MVSPHETIPLRLQDVWFGKAKSMARIPAFDFVRKRERILRRDRGAKTMGETDLLPHQEESKEGWTPRWESSPLHAMATKFGRKRLLVLPLSTTPQPSVARRLGSALISCGAAGWRAGEGSKPYFRSHDQRKALWQRSFPHPRWPWPRC